MRGPDANDKNPTSAHQTNGVEIQAKTNGWVLSSSRRLFQWFAGQRAQDNSSGPRKTRNKQQIKIRMVTDAILSGPDYFWFPICILPKVVQGGVWYDQVLLSPKGCLGIYTEHIKKYFPPKPIPVTGCSLMLLFHESVFCQHYPHRSRWFSHWMGSWTCKASQSIIYGWQPHYCIELFSLVIWLPRASSTFPA